ncbi:ABC transporter ATPase [Mesonia ostreae]|uniref:ABC transporter ATPase n=1 Tax=Mesonia ostreae TaxID=861110 RepID=A0ABU2KI53_9FLAO|nr:ABC transporter ATPase [Mesonia ostreae]MDT0294354.1 ABC transporter ATPase [Mesonia ostreae]
MHVDFKELPLESKIWIYQSNRPFTPEEIQELEQEVAEFLVQWAAHGSNLKAGFEIRYRRFIIIGLDQSLQGASGCSIDASVHFIQDLEKKYEVDLLDKMNVTFKQGEFIAYKTLIDFKKIVKNRSVSPKTIVFNNLVNTKEEYLHDWEIPIEESWHKRFL